MRPEQSRALAYLERKGTESPIRIVVRDVATAFKRLEERLDALAGLATDERPAPGQWSLVEIVDHLVASHRPAVEQLRAALNGTDPGDAIPAGLQSAEPTSVGWSDRVSELQRVHEDFLDELSKGEDCSPPSTIPVAMVVKAAEPSGDPSTLEWIESLHWKAFAIGVKAHTLEHLAQVERTADLLRQKRPGQ